MSFVSRAVVPLSTLVPLPDSGSGAIGSSTNAAREDHVHPSVGTSSIYWKDAVRVATTTLLAASSDGTTITASSNGSINTGGIDGVTTLALNDRVLVKNGLTGPTNVYNGIYYISDLGSVGTPFKLVRSLDANTSPQVKSGMACLIEEGGQADQVWALSTPDAITINATSLTFVKVGGASYTPPTFDVGTGCPYTTIVSAVTAATIAGGGVIRIFAGTYSETFNLPSNVCLQGESPTRTLILGPITCTATSGAQYIRDLQVANVYISGAGPAAIDLVNLNVVPTLAATYGLSISSTNWTLVARNCSFDTKTNSIAAAAVSVTATVVSAEFTDCTFTAPNSQMSVILAGGAYTFTRPTFNRPISGSAAATVDFTNVTCSMFGTAPAYLIQGYAGSTYRVHGNVVLSGITATGSLTNGTGTLAADGGVFLGTYQTAHLPVVSTDGALAYSSDDTVLKLRASGAWVTAGGPATQRAILAEKGDCAQVTPSYQVMGRFYYDPAEWSYTGKSFYWQTVFGSSDNATLATVKFYNATSGNYIEIDGGSTVILTSVASTPTLKSLSFAAASPPAHFAPATPCMIEVHAFVASNATVNQLSMAQLVVK